MFGLFRARNKKPLAQAKHQSCPFCGAMDWHARGRGEIVERYGHAYIRQYHICGTCGVRFNLVRVVYDDTWHFTTAAASIRA